MASVFIMCNPLMDLIVPAKPEWLKELGAHPGSMNLIDYTVVEKILAKNVRARKIPGGSGANTARGLAWLRGSDSALSQPAFLGAVGRDEQGIAFDDLLKEAGVASYLVKKSGLPTGVSAILVTPDHERTMFTHLGACRLLEGGDVPETAVKASSYFYLTGYNWDTPNQEKAAREAAAAARGAGVKICLDVADPFVANRYREALLSWIPGTVDILFANRDELKALMACEGSDEDIIGKAGNLSPLVVMKVGKDGCLVLSQKGLLRIPGERVVPKDTTAAGDSFAAGFLHGLLSGKELNLCGKIANRVASGMVTVEGCDYASLDRGHVLKLMKEG